MKAHSFLQRAADRLLAPFGYEVRLRRPAPAPFTMDGILERLASRGTEIGTIVDLGAASGRWTRKALRHFPAARYLLVEPLEERRAALGKLQAEHPQVGFATAAAGDRAGEATLTVSSDLDGSGIYEGAAAGVQRTVPIITLDGELARRELPGPYLLKFDTHGFELPILAGAAETLKRTNVLVIEAYNFQLSRGSLRFHELCAHLESLGFRCADLADPMLRPRDGLLWQLDLVFLRRDADCFTVETFA